MFGSARQHQNHIGGAWRIHHQKVAGSTGQSDRQARKQDQGQHPPTIHHGFPVHTFSSSGRCSQNPHSSRLSSPTLSRNRVLESKPQFTSPGRNPVATMTNPSAGMRSVDQFKNKIQQRKAQVGIIGLGYVGLPLALLFSEQKFAVTGFDIDQRKVDTLAQGGSYIYRISKEEIQAAKSQGFSATSDYARLVDIDAVIICVRSE